MCAALNQRKLVKDNTLAESILSELVETKFKLNFFFCPEMKYNSNSYSGFDKLFASGPFYLSVFLLGILLLQPKLVGGEVVN